LTPGRGDELVVIKLRPDGKLSGVMAPELTLVATAVRVQRPSRRATSVGTDRDDDRGLKASGPSASGLSEHAAIGVDLGTKNVEPEGADLGAAIGADLGAAIGVDLGAEDVELEGADLGVALGVDLGAGRRPERGDRRRPGR